MSNQTRVNTNVFRITYHIFTDCIWDKITSMDGMKQVVFKEYANASLGRKFTSLFPGLGYAAGYKVCKADHTRARATIG